MRVRRTAPAVALATLHGLTALFLGAAAGWWLLGGANLWRVTLGDFNHPAAWVPTAALGLAAIGVVAAPLIAAPLRRAGGWVVAALAVTAAHLISIEFPNGIRRPTDPIELPHVIIIMLAGVGVGGIVVALFAVRPVARLAMVSGLVAGLLLGPELVAVTGGVPTVFEGGGPWWVVGLGVGGALVSLVVAWRTERGVAADAPAGPHARMLSLVLPLAVVAAAAMVLLAADRALFELLRVIISSASPETTTPDRLVATLTRVDGFTRMVILLVLGAGISIYAYLLRGGSAARWVWTGFGAGLPLVVWNRVDRQFTIVYFTTDQPMWALVPCGLAAAGAGVVLARYAGRTVPWDVVGLLVAAAGLVIGGIVQVEELQMRGSPSYLNLINDVYPYVLGFGVGLAVAAGLGRLAALPATGRRPPASRAGDATLGIAAALLAVPVLTPLLVSVLRDRPDPSAGPSVLPVVAVVVAAGAATLFYVLERVLPRRRHDQRGAAGLPTAYPSTALPTVSAPPAGTEPPAGPGSVAAPDQPDAPTPPR